MNSKNKTDIRMMNLLKAYDTVRLKRWSSVFVPPDIVDTSDIDEEGNIVNHKSPIQEIRETSRGDQGGVDLSNLFFNKDRNNSVLKEM